MVFKFLKNQLKKGEDPQEGDIAQKIDGETRTEHFIRAETHTDREQAISHTITKAKRIIDERSGGL